MHTGQTMLTLAALMLLSSAMIVFNTALSNSDIALTNNRYRLEALSIMQSYLEQASQHYFDEASNDTTTAKRLNDFVLPKDLGFDIDDGGKKISICHNGTTLEIPAAALKAHLAHGDAIGPCGGGGGTLFGNGLEQIPDDFDDYHGQMIFETGRSGVHYKLEFQVDYVKLQGNQIVTSNARQYHKRMRISIVDDYHDPLIYRYEGGMKVHDTLRVEFVYSYWFYN